jgi:lysophospholipase L1-like esterase
MSHVVLLGDSIFDNAAYVAGGQDVVRQLRERLGVGSQATLCAVDGAVTSDVLRQLECIPPDATHLVVSVGGNDALGHSGVLDQAARSMAEAIWRLAHIREEFARGYGAMLEQVLRLGLPVAVCTIYDGRFADPRQQRLGMTALTIFNDAITRHAFRRGLDLIDLRVIFTEESDYANPIEPSVQGGAKIASAIAEMVAEQDVARRRSVVFA